jgi:transcriptional regulator with XRE-family HTH domain
MPAKQPDEATRALGDAVAYLRKAKGWQQADLARALGAELGRTIDPTLITRLEAGRRQTPSGDLAALAAVLGVPVGSLIYSDDPFYDNGFTEWQFKAMHDNARASLRDAARQYGETSAAVSAFASDAGWELESAADIAAEAEAEGWNAEVDRQNV